MTAYVDCLKSFAHLVPGASEPELVDALRFAVIEFCAKTFVLTDWYTKTSAAMTFDTTGDAGLMPVALFDAYVDGVQTDIFQVNATQVADATDTSRVITYKVDQLATSIAITPAPATALPVRLLVAMAPTPDSNEYPDHLWMIRREAMKAGALSRLLAEPGTTYVNDVKAVWYRKQFEDAIASASTAASVNRSTSTQRLRVTPS